MTDFLNNLQNKSDGFKRIIMWLGVFSVMTAIFMFWLLTFPSQIPASENDETVNNFKKELPGIWQSLNGQYNDLKNLWQK
ncbi:MAG: hypothetical protein Q7R61_00700 [bacterium]|nr:hypothetical protein [bacterium]